MKISSIGDYKFSVLDLETTGFSSLNHLRMLKSLGVEAAIVGKALYTGDINLKQALAAVS